MKRAIVLMSCLALWSVEALACEGSKPRRLIGAQLSAEATSQFEKGQALEKVGRIQDAVKLYTEAARGNHGPSARVLSVIYDRGKGDVAKDYRKSLTYAYLAYDLGEDIRFACR